jgi:hypothetical protein
MFVEISLLLYGESKVHRDNLPTQSLDVPYMEKIHRHSQTQW